jgi:flagellar biosynthesis/type III secretory pathway protein FliH
LSPKEEEGVRLSTENAFRLHYFPEIPLDPTGRHRSSPGDGMQLRDHRFVRDGGGADLVDAAVASDCLRLAPDEIETQAYNRGFNKGEKAGLQSAAEKIEALGRMLTDAAEELARLHARFRREAEKEIVELAMAVAARVVCHEVKTNRESVVHIVRQALAKVDHPDAVVIKMNPAEVELLERSRLNLSEVFQKADGIRIEADEDIGCGGCLIETGGGDVDARIEKQLQVVREALLEYLDGGQP